MATITTLGTTNFSNTLVALIQKRLEEELRSPLPHLMPGNFRPASFIPGTSNTMRFIRINDFSVVTGTPTPGTPPWLTEGVTPTTEDITIGFEEFTASQAGRVWKFSDKALLQSPFDLMAVGAERIARNALATADKRVADVLGAGTNVMYQAGNSSATVVPGSILTGATVKLAVARLKSANVPTFPDGTYHAINHPGVTYDLESDTAVGGWIDAQRYAGAQALFTGEVGRYAGVRFIESANSFSKVDTGFGSALPSVTFTTATDLVNSTGHGLVAGNKVQFQSIATNTGFAINTTYYVVNPTTNNFQISLTPNGSAIDITGADGAGTGKRVSTVRSTIIFGPEAYAFGDWGTIDVAVTPPGGHDDPLKQSALIGWKGYFGALLIESAGARYMRIESSDTL